MVLFLNWNELEGYSITTYRKGSQCSTMEEFQADINNEYNCTIELDKVSREHASEELKDFLEYMENMGRI